MANIHTISIRCFCFIKLATLPIEITVAQIEKFQRAILVPQELFLASYLRTINKVATTKSIQVPGLVHLLKIIIFGSSQWQSQCAFGTQIKTLGIFLGFIFENNRCAIVANFSNPMLPFFSLRQSSNNNINSSPWCTIWASTEFMLRHLINDLLGQTY